jgi:hypothetical protein
MSICAAPIGCRLVLSQLREFRYRLEIERN